PGKETKLLLDALNNDFWFIRSTALNALADVKPENSAALVSKVEQIAKQDKKGSVRADAILLLSGWGGEKYSKVYEAALNDSSYQVAAAGILAYANTESPDKEQKL